MLDPAAKEQRQQEILDKQQAAQSRQFQLEQQSETRRGELLKPILDNVREIIEQIRAEREYSIVFDIAESGVIAADPELDITGAVLARLGVQPTTDPTSGR
jgi:Skp family chaperone for outer membrane proteins